MSIFTGITSPPDWTARAVCAQTDAEAFFPEVGTSPGPAKTVCRRCPVRGDCLELALASDERFGIWGGLTPPERRQIKRDRRAAGVERRSESI